MSATQSCPPVDMAQLESLIDSKIEERLATANRATIVVFSGEMDKLMAAFVIATGAVAMGMQVSMFFTFWGLAAVKKTTVLSGKAPMEKMLAGMLPGGPGGTATSSLNMLGLGPRLFRQMMKKKNVSSLEDLIEMAGQMGVRMVGCQMSMDVMGIKEEELIDNMEYGGVATYLADARDSKVTLFI